MSYIASNLDVKKHFFFGREGGVSQGKYSSLNTNLNSKDNQQHIKCNFEIVAGHFGLTCEDMFTIRQSVSNVVAQAELPLWFKAVADGVVTTKPGILLGIKTADCAPVLFADYKNGVIGAAHAGWRGAYSGILENVVKLMVKNGAEISNIAVAIGPCIQQHSFEVKSDMRDIIIEDNIINEKFFISAFDNEHFLFDLSGYIAHRLYEVGISNIVNSRIDTYPKENGYFSYRRFMHNGLISASNDYPTQFSAIML